MHAYIGNETTKIKGKRPNKLNQRNTYNIPNAKRNESLSCGKNGGDIYMDKY